MMDALVLSAEWKPVDGYQGGHRDIQGKQATIGCKVWRNPEVSIEKLPIPKPAADEVVLKVKACGICGSDIHMSQRGENGYILYPGLTSFPVILGHELSGVVVEAGSQALNRNTGFPFEKGELFCAEEMHWCGSCSPCVMGDPNYCENLNEMGFNRNGGFAEYVSVPAKSLWSLEALKRNYSGRELFIAGSLIEPVAVSYNAIYTLSGGIIPGQIVIVNGGGPIGLAACMLAKRSGASKVILIEPSESRRDIGRNMGADYVLDNETTDLEAEIMRFTEGAGAHLYVEASGYTADFWRIAERCIWNGRVIGARFCIVSRSEERIDVSPDVLQVKKVSLSGAIGHAGHNNFHNAIELVADCREILAMVTKTISLPEVPEELKSLQKNKTDCKVTVLME